MVAKKIFPLLLTLVLLVSIIGVFPAIAAPQHSVSTFLVKGPQAIPADVQGPDYGLFTCQVGMSSHVCYDPFQMRRAYGIDTLINQGYDGTGRTIVIIDAFQSATLEADLDAFDTFYGLPPRSAFFTQIAPDGLGPDDNGWAGEITLDVEWAHAIAPGAHIVLVLAKSSQNADIVSATKYAVDNNLGDVISQSFGENEVCDLANILAEHKVFVAATNKHITLLAASGDEGSAQMTCDGTSWTQVASSPASDPLVTAVGGTELRAAKYCFPAYGCNPLTNPLPGTWLSEVTWSEFDSNIASGGGFSQIFVAPPYQQLAGGRGVPDVAYSAAVYHGVLVNFQGGWWLFGGTSAGSPQWAALVAIADQISGRSLGFINKALYRYGAAAGRYSSYFHDITVGNNSVVEYDINNNPVPVPGWNAVPGWDAATGLGSPIASLLFYLPINVKDLDAQLAIAASNPHTAGLTRHGQGKENPY